MPILQHLSWIGWNTPTFSLSNEFQSSYGHVYSDPFFWSTLYVVYVGIIYSKYNVDGGRSNVLTPASVIMIKMDCENISTKFHT